jgi:RNA polymerase subunit RPABC4/transcription elongation factor Spt4
LHIASEASTVSVGPNGTGRLGFRVLNSGSAALRPRVEVVALPPTQAAWLEIEGSNELPLLPGTSAMVTVRISAPAGLAPGDYPFRLDAIDPDQGDQWWTRGPIVTLVIGVALVVCRNCGHPNPADEKFCGNCGSFLEWTGEATRSSTPVSTPPSTPPPAAVQPIEAPAAQAATPKDAGVPSKAGSGPQICRVCGHLNDAGRRFCRHCGSELAPAQASASPPQASRGLPFGLGVLLRRRDTGASTPVDAVDATKVRVERRTSATFPAEVEAGAIAPLVFSIGEFLPGGVQGLVSVEVPAQATSVELVATVHAPAFEVLSPAPPPGGRAPVVELSLNVMDPSWAERGEFILRAKPQAMPTDTVILLDFWHRASPVGQIRIETRVVPEGQAASRPGKRSSGGQFRVSGAAPPPADITLFITDEGGGRYQIQATTPKVFMRELGEFPAGQNAWSYSQSVLARFRDAGTLPEAARIDRVVGLGLDLWDNLPAAFHDFYWEELDGRDPSIAIYSQEPYIPWELIRPPKRGDRTPGFLGSDFRVARWRNGRLFPDPLAVRDFVVIAPEYTDRPLPATAIEAADLVTRFGARVVDGQYDPVAASLRSPEIQLVHFAGHGSYVEGAPLQSQIRLADHDLLPTDVRTFRQGLGSGPFVFLNACEVGEQGWAFTGIGGWADVFCDVGCAGFVGPYWEVVDDVARLAALRFYDGLAAGKPVGEAVRDVRRAFDEPGPYAHHPTWLAYSLHCQPNIRIDLKG